MKKFKCIHIDMKTPIFLADDVICIRALNPENIGKLIAETYKTQNLIFNYRNMVLRINSDDIKTLTVSGDTLKIVMK